MRNGSRKNPLNFGAAPDKGVFQVSISLPLFGLITVGPWQGNVLHQVLLSCFWQFFLISLCFQNFQKQDDTKKLAERNHFKRLVFVSVSHRLQSRFLPLHRNWVMTNNPNKSNLFVAVTISDLTQSLLLQDKLPKEKADKAQIFPVTLIIVINSAFRRWKKVVQLFCEAQIVWLKTTWWHFSNTMFGEMIRISIKCYIVKEIIPSLKFTLMGVRELSNSCCSDFHWAEKQQTPNRTEREKQKWSVLIRVGPIKRILSRSLSCYPLLIKVPHET